MILVDYSNLIISNITAEYNQRKKRKLDFEISEDLVRHMIFNSVKSYFKKFGKEYGKGLIFCVDAKDPWRKTIFPLYKYRRKEDKEKSDIDWSEVYRVLNKIKLELIEFTPYKVVEVENAEGDDIIYVLSDLFKTTRNDKILIVSNDKDFINIIDGRVSLFRPLLDEHMICDSHSLEHFWDSL